MNICGPVLPSYPTEPYGLWMVYNCETRKLRAQITKDGAAIYEDTCLQKAEDVLQELLQQ